MLWILALIIAFAAGLWVYRADKRREVPYPWLTAALRVGAFLLLFVLLFAPSILTNKNETRKPLVVFLQDNSTSIKTALSGDTAAYTSSKQQLLDKLSEKYKVVQLAFGNELKKEKQYDYTDQATDISSALHQVQESYGRQNLGAVILATDGRYNLGADPLYQSLSITARLHAVSIGDTAVQKDIVLTRLYANKVVSLNSNFEIRADIVARQCAGYNSAVRVLEAGKEISGEAIQIRESRYDRSVAFNMTADKPGLHHYTIIVSPADGEANVANNKKELFIQVQEDRKKIFILAAAPHPDLKAIKEALDATDQFDITVRSDGEMPADITKADLLILHDLPTLNRPDIKIPSELPVWFIVGAHVNAAVINRLQDAALLELNTALVHDALPAYDRDFSGFLLPPGVASVMDKMAPLSRPIGNVRIKPGTDVLLQSREDNNPLWFFRQGARPTAILTGEGIWRWRLYEYRYFNNQTVVDECIRQTVSYLTTDATKEPFKVELAKFSWADQEPVFFSARLLNAANQQVNDPDVQLTITDSSGNKQDISFERVGSAYRVNTGLHAGGIYQWTATTVLEGKKMQQQGSFAVASIPLEQMETGADYPFLYALSRKYNGSVVPAGNMLSLYDSISNDASVLPLIDTVTDAQPIVNWKWLFFLILALLTTEWLLRKYWMAQ